MRKENRRYVPHDEMKLCDRCGFATHWSTMEFQDGYWLCTERGCVDEEDETSIDEDN